ncbi:MAG: outer membrane beta-barrel protein [Gammaproteobacteria bacterium]|nr:outer membrane beta-barrel protein [Gammaproteobacteria bacterium]
MIRNILAAAAAFFALSSAQAAEEELYVGVAIGQYEADLGGSDENSGYGEFFAGVQPTENLFIEVGYSHLDGFEDGSKGNIIKLSLLRQIQFGSSFSLVGRAFLSNVDLRGPSGTDDETTLGFGAGIMFGGGEEGTNKFRIEYQMADPGTDDDSTYIQASLMHFFQ